MYTINSVTRHLHILYSYTGVQQLQKISRKSTTLSEKFLSTFKAKFIKNIIFNYILKYFSLLTILLRRKSRVKVWDSGNPLVEEYTRSCQQWTDRQPLNEAIFHNPYFNCLDRIHPGYVALNQATQILLNHICNHHLINE